MPESISNSFKYSGTDMLVVGRSIASAKHPTRNEDIMKFDPNNKLALVLDGSSGSDDGLLAAQIGERFLLDRLSGIETHLPRTLRRMGSALEEGAHHLRETGRYLHTTASASKFVDLEDQRFMVYGHVGDTRDFLLRDDKLSRITQDHDLVHASTLPPERQAAITRILDEIATFSQVEELRKRGSEIFKYFDNQNWVVQILGRRQAVLPSKWEFSLPLKPKDWVSPYVDHMEVFPGDCLIKATDGLNNLRVSEIEGLLRNSNPQDRADILAEAAFTRSKDDHVRAVPDDITVLVVNIGEKVKECGDKDNS